MDKAKLDEHCESVYIDLNLDRLSFAEIVSSYDSTLRTVFSDNIYNLGRYFVLSYLARYITKRLTHVNSDLLLRVLLERLEKKWHSSSNT